MERKVASESNSGSKSRMKLMESKNDPNHTLKNKKENKFQNVEKENLTTITTIKLTKSNPTLNTIGVSLSTYEPKTDQLEAISCIHYVSAVSGIFLACGLSIFFCLIPQHDILEEPYYWYETMVLTAFFSSLLRKVCLALQKQFQHLKFPLKIWKKAYFRIVST